MNVFGEIIADVAGLIAILTGMRFGFHWLESQLQNKIETEVKKTIHSELSALENKAESNTHRIEILEMWLRGFQVGRIPPGHELGELGDPENVG